MPRGRPPSHAMRQMAGSNDEDYFIRDIIEKFVRKTPSAQADQLRESRPAVQGPLDKVEFELMEVASRYVSLRAESPTISPRPSQEEQGLNDHHAIFEIQNPK
jgi:hypothetical protein